MPVITYFEVDDGDKWGVAEGRLLMGGHAIADAREFADFIYSELAKADPDKDAPANPEDDGWIEWKGGPCLVDGNALVDVITREGNVLVRMKAEYLHWLHYGDGMDIMRYRPAKGGAE